MPVSQSLLEILCCPSTKVPVEPLCDEAISQLNALIDEHKLRYIDDTVVDKSISEALVTTNHELIYRVDDDIPVMLEERAISADILDCDKCD